jgi:hypothetical protein
MPKRGERDWLTRAAWGLTSGMLALAVLTAGGGSASLPGTRSVLAEDIDCYNDKDLYDLPECVERRALDKKSGNGQNEAQGATGQSTDQQSTGGGSQQSSDGGTQQQSSGGSQQASGGGQQQQGNGGSTQQASGGGQSGGGQQQASGGGQQQQAAPSDDEDKPEPPRGPLTDPKQAVLTAADAGKEATQYLSEEGTDKYGKWARTRFERDRSNGASALGPNVMDSKVWVANDLATAKTLFAEQSAIKSFPERKEQVQGPVEKLKPTKFGEDFAFVSGYYEDGDQKIWQHWRFVIRQGNSVAVVYLFGKEEYFQDKKDKTWVLEGDYFTSTVAGRL